MIIVPIIRNIKIKVIVIMHMVVIMMLIIIIINELSTSFESS